MYEAQLHARPVGGHPSQEGSTRAERAMIEEYRAALAWDDHKDWRATAQLERHEYREAA